jgi:hypothetical protein
VSRSPVPLMVKASSRDHGLRRVRGATGWIAALAALGGLTLAGGYAVALPGKPSSRAASTTTGSGQSAFGQPVPPSTTPRHATSSHKHRAHALQPPAQAPAPAQAPPATVSGAS